MTADERTLAANDLPDGWVWATLGEACEVNLRMNWPESFTEETLVSFVPMAAVDDVTGSIVAAESRPIGEVWRGYKRFAEGDVIFARITPCMENGKAAIATGLLNGVGLGSTEFHVLRPTEATSAKWVYHFVRQESFRNEATREMTGTAGQLRVPRSFIENASFPLAPLPEQERIVAKIEALFRQSRRAREALDGIPDLLAQFRQAVLAAAFRGELSERNPDDEPAAVLLERIRAERRRRWEEELRAKGKDPSQRKYNQPAEPDASSLPEGWVWTSLSAVADIQSGAGFPKQFQGQTSGDYPFAKVSDISAAVLENNGQLSTAANYVSAEVAAGLQAKVFPSGSTLFAKIGEAVKLNRRAIASVPVLADNNVMGVVPEEHCLEPRFLNYYLRTVDMYLYSQATTVPSVRKTVVEEIEIPVPPLMEQRRIVARIEALFAQADILEAQVAAARRRLEQVDQAILARAFRGELVEQDPDDESASALLERIRREREGQKARG